MNLRENAQLVFVAACALGRRLGVGHFPTQIFFDFEAKRINAPIGDEIFEARVLAVFAVAVIAVGFGDRFHDFHRLLRPDENLHVLRDMRLGRKSAASHQAIADFAIRAARAVKRQAVDFELSAVAMTENANFELARQIGIFGIARKILIRFDCEIVNVNQFFGFVTR